MKAGESFSIAIRSSCRPRSTTNCFNSIVGPGHFSLIGPVFGSHAEQTCSPTAPHRLHRAYHLVGIGILHLWDTLRKTVVCKEHRYRYLPAQQRKTSAAPDEYSRRSPRSIRDNGANCNVTYRRGTLQRSPCFFNFLPIDPDTQKGLLRSQTGIDDVLGNAAEQPGTGLLDTWMPMPKPDVDLMTPHLF